jgi:SAM-dependent methyltransferase
MQKQKNKFTHLTAIERTNLSYPAKFLLNQELLQSKILDFGCGLGIDVKLLQQKGYDITGYDPYYFPQYPHHKFDTIICFYVLNVLFPEEQANVLMEVSHMLLLIRLVMSGFYGDCKICSSQMNVFGNYNEYIRIFRNFRLSILN